MHHPPSLTCLTYNVWFGDYHFDERCTALLAILEQSAADIIALQEVTPAFLERLFHQPWVKHYTLSNRTLETPDSYDVVILSRHPFQKITRYSLPSTMGRSLLIAEVAFQNTTLTIATTHLESRRASSPIRAQQLELIFRVLETAEHAIFMGDFNFCSSWQEENRLLDARYTDIWTAVEEDALGYTEDTNINMMRLMIKQKTKQVRFDRVLLRSGRPGWQPQSIRIIGSEPIQPTKPNVFPSDHFGLLATIKWDG